jgi:hypothetical protein
MAILPLRQTCPLVRESRCDSSNHWALLTESAFKRGSDREPNHSFLHCHFSSNLSALIAILFPYHGDLTPTPIPQPSIADESEICKLIVSYFLPDREVLQWRPAVSEDIPTPNTNEIMVFSSFQRGFGLPVCDFLCGLLDHYQIKLVHLNPNSIVQITVFVHLCEAYHEIPPKLSLVQKLFLLKIPAEHHKSEDHRWRRTTDSPSCWFS